MSVVGERRIGKTSLLNQVYQQLALHIKNPTSEVAKNLNINLENCDGISWHHKTSELPFIEREQERSNYVNLNDLEHAADKLIKAGSAAFEQHWQNCNTNEHYLLSGLAWATDELNRRQLDLNGIKAALKEVRLEIDDQTIFQIVERFTDEEILIRDGPTYRFAVPLYRRWVAWCWPVDIIRNEVL